MNRVIVTLPDEIHAQLKQLAKCEGVSVNQYVTYAIAKQVERVNIEPPAGNTGGKALNSGNRDLAIENLL